MKYFSLIKMLSAAGLPQGAAPSGGSDPRSGGSWGRL
jgi:hypothetical protein